MISKGSQMQKTTHSMTTSCLVWGCELPLPVRWELQQLPPRVIILANVCKVPGRMAGLGKHESGGNDNVGVII